MTEEGVNGLSLSEVARRLGVKPPSIYKYFDSLLAIYDALFERGQRTHLEIMRTAMARADPGLDALAAGLEASGRWALAHPATAQLLFWRPVPSFQPTPEAMAPSVEMVRLQRQALADAANAEANSAPVPTPTRRSGSHRSSSVASSARRWPTSPASPGAKAASARCSPSFSTHSPPSTLPSPRAAGPEVSAQRGCCALDTNDRWTRRRSDVPERSSLGHRTSVPEVPSSGPDGRPTSGGATALTLAPSTATGVAVRRCRWARRGTEWAPRSLGRRESVAAAGPGRESCGGRRRTSRVPRAVRPRCLGCG